MKSVGMLSRPELESLLRQSIFSSLDAQSFDAMSSLFDQVEYERGEVIRAAGSASDGLYVLVSGRVVTCNAEDYGVISTYERGECLGLMSTFFPGPLPHDTRALETTRVLRLDAGSLRMIELSDPRLAVQLYRCIRLGIAPTVNQSLRMVYDLLQS